MGGGAVAGSEAVVHPFSAKWMVKLAPNDPGPRVPAALKLSNHDPMSGFAGGHWGGVLVGPPI
eukprot:scaffold123546_cov17-Tisochrysis_lutea.AAC.3